jgi:hypothetical protein
MAQVVPVVTAVSVARVVSWTVGMVAQVVSLSEGCIQSNTPPQYLPPVATPEPLLQGQTWFR